MKSILFSNAEMVRAVHHNRKTTTRQVIKVEFLPGFNPEWTGYRPVFEYGEFFLEGSNHRDATKRVKPKYHIGDILYVREPYAISAYTGPENTPHYCFKADKTMLPSGEKWKSSVLMPKEAARIFIRITDIRPERLQNMSHDSPLKEGIQAYTKDDNLYKYALSVDFWANYHDKHKNSFKGTWWQDMPKNPTKAYSYLWDSTIKNAAIPQYGWDANPWVWVISFELCKNPLVTM